MNWRHLILVVLTVFWISPHCYAAEISGRFVELPEVKLWVIDSGGSGEPVILLHPRMGNSEYWQYTMPALAEAGFRAIAIDYPSWGKSTLREGQQPVPVADILKTLIDSLGLEQVHLVGTSLGGYIALDFTAWQPDRVKSMVIAASGLGLENDPQLDAFSEHAQIPESVQLPAEVREFGPNYRGMNPQGVARWKEIASNAQHKDTKRPPLRSRNTPEKVASIAVPTFVITGGADLVSPSGTHRLWSRHLTVAYEFLLMPEAGHGPMWEQPDEFNQALINFLQKH